MEGKFENNEFKNHEELASKISEMLKISIVELLENNYTYIGIGLSEFMDMCNDQEIELENYWVSYIKINS